MGFLTITLPVLRDFLVVKIMAQLTLFKVRDLRKKDQFKIDDVYLNGYARVCGANATLVYLSLCRHAEFESQKAFPSQNKIAFELGISVASVKRGIKILTEYNIIQIEKEKIGGKFNNNVYFLLDKSGWKPTIAPTDTRQDHSSKTIAHQPPTAGDTLKDNKVLRITNIKDNKENTADLKIGRVKNNIELLVDYFLELKGWADQPKEFYIENNIPKYNRFLRPARDLLSLFDGSVEKTKEYLDKMKELADKEGFDDWVIETAIKYYLELNKKVR